MNTVTPFLLDVDTGTDDAAALWLASTTSTIELVAATVTFGNAPVDVCVRNTATMLDACGSAAALHRGAAGPAGPAPVLPSASMVMGSDAFGDLGLPDPVGAPRGGGLDAAHAIVDAARAHEGRLTIVALGPLTNLAAALELDPDLPHRVADLVVLGGAFAGGNVTAAAEANMANDPVSAGAVVAAFGAPGALAGGRPPRLVPLDAARQLAIGRGEVDVLADSPVAGAHLLHRVLTAVWPMATLETGGEAILLADLVAVLLAADDSLASWETLPLSVDTGGSAAWGATIADHRIRLVERAVGDEDLRGALLAMMGVAPARWSIARTLDVERCRAALAAACGHE